MISSVRVPVATLWAGPDAAREIDTAAVADEPDVKAWAGSLGTEARQDLHGRVLTQLLRGEPVDVVSEHEDGWTEVVARWQPSSRHEDGYPGWLRRAHLTSQPADSVAAPRPSGEHTPYPRGEDLLQTARPFLGTGYVWGGTCEHAIDCSGLVHWVLRRHGLMVPRDAHDQEAASASVPLGEEQVGDLYFFARPERAVHHVGFVVARGVMLHAPESGQRVVEEPLSEELHKTLVAAGRF